MLLRQCQNGKLFRHVEKGKALQNKDGTVVHGSGQSIVLRYIMTYYNRIRIYTGNPGGLPPAMYRQAARGVAA